MKNGDMPATAQSNNEIAKAFMEVEDCAPNGLTKREAFAMAAMQGLLANSEFPTSINGVEVCEYGLCASAAVQQADALLKELAK